MQNISTIKKRELLYEGKAKAIYKTNEEGILIQHFKDDITAGNGAKKDEISGKGRLNCLISAKIIEGIEKLKICPTHFLGLANENEQVIRQVDIIPLEVIIRNKIAGSFAKRYGKKEGEDLEHTIIEFCLKDDNLADPPISEDSISALGILTEEGQELIKLHTSYINAFLSGIFFTVGAELIDFKIEFGRDINTGEILLADEISPDSCRIWDINTGQKLDKDVYRKNLGDVKSSYEELARRLGVL